MTKPANPKVNNLTNLENKLEAKLPQVVNFIETNPVLTGVGLFTLWYLLKR